MGRTEPERNEEVNSKSLFESSLTLEEEQNNVGNTAFLTSYSLFLFLFLNHSVCFSVISWLSWFAQSMCLMDLCSMLRTKVHSSVKLGSH